MEKRDEVTIKQLVDYLALKENISWAKRRLEKLEEEQTLYKDLIQENADELIRLLAESYAYYSVVYDNDLYCEAASEMLAFSSDALEKDDKIQEFIRAIGITQEDEERLRSEGIL